MGDLVAVMQQGGKLAQFGTAGGDPRLARVRVRGAVRGGRPRAQAAVAGPGARPRATPGLRRGSARRGRGTPGRSATRSRICCWWTRDGRPLGWVQRGRHPGSGPLTADLAQPTRPILGPRTTLKDALSMMLDADVTAGDRGRPDGRPIGLLTVDQIAEALRDAPRGPARDRPAADRLELDRHPPRRHLGLHRRAHLA